MTKNKKIAPPVDNPKLFLDANGIAELLGVGKSTVYNYVAEEPKLEEGKNRYYAPRFLGWYLQNIVGTNAKLRLDIRNKELDNESIKLKNDALKRQAQEETGRLINISKVREDTINVASLVIRRLEYLPRKCALQVVDVTAPEAEAIIAKEVYACRKAIEDDLDRLEKQEKGVISKEQQHDEAGETKNKSTAQKENEGHEAISSGEPAEHFQGASAETMGRDIQD